MKDIPSWFSTDKDFKVVCLETFLKCKMIPGTIGQMEIFSFVFFMFVFYSWSCSKTKICLYVQPSVPNSVSHFKSTSVVHPSNPYVRPSVQLSLCMSILPYGHLFVWLFYVYWLYVHPFVRQPFVRPLHVQMGPRKK